MAAFILLAGVLNFVLGYFLALALADPPFLNLLTTQSCLKLGQGISLLGHRLIFGSNELDAKGEDGNASSNVAECAQATYQELPEAWQHALRDDAMEPGSFASGVVNFLRLEGAVYREHLLTAEARARQALAVQNPLAMEQLAADLRFINVDWSGKQRQAADLIEDRVGRLGPSEVSVTQFSKLLRDQEAQIAEIDREIHSLNFRSDGTIACRRMLEEMQQLIHLAHWLRDEAQVALAAIHFQEALQDMSDRKFHYDAVTGLLGRLGVESLFARETSAGRRPTAAMRIKIDRFGKVNQRLGARAGDQVLKAVARFAAELAATLCAKSTLARLAGSEFLLLASEATAEELTTISEQIRQSFEAAGFSYQGTDLSLSLTISVAAIAADAGLSEIFSRLDAAQEVALRAGRNRSARWENGAAVLTLPPAIPVQAKTIAVEAAAA